MANNRNLFYQLYSTSNNTINSGYICNNAVDEHDTSFDISASSVGTVGSITDSNGSTLSEISLESLHAAGITQYVNETRILQPYSCCLLLGQEYGLAYASYYFILPENIIKIKDYEFYITIDFDFIYNSFNPLVYHIHAQADENNEFINIINDELENNNIQVSVSLLEIDKKEYIVFLSQSEGYFYYINNLKLSPTFLSANYPRSPFSKNISGIKSVIYNIVEEYNPIKKINNINSSCYCDINDGESHQVDCDLYKWILYNYEQAANDLDKFKSTLTLLNTITSDMSESEIVSIIEKANLLIKNTPFDSDIINEYDLENMDIIASIIESIKNIIELSNEYFLDVYWLDEDKLLRVPLKKYPNGAFRGIVLIPDWPNDDYEYSSIWINHVKSKVKIYKLDDDGHYIPKEYGVMSNATLMSEQDEYVSTSNSSFGTIQSNGNLTTSINNGLDTDYIDPYRPENSVYSDTFYMGQNCYDNKDNIIGIFRYMQYVNENNLWDKVGQGYIIIGNPDDPQSHNFNLPTSLLVYNPNNIPLRIKYMIFS